MAQVEYAKGLKASSPPNRVLPIDAKTKAVFTAILHEISKHWDYEEVVSAAV